MNQKLFELSKLVFVDCGASYFPPDTWLAALGSPLSHLILVDPNGQNLTYASNMPCKTSFIPKALHSIEGLKTIYMTNTDSGSSLLPPVGRPQCIGVNPGYFLPITAKSISTSTLCRELDFLSIPVIDCIKLDTQGTELSILQGLDKCRLNDLLFIEAEVSLQNPPIYKNAASFSDFASFLEPQGFEIANIRLSRPEPKDVNSLPSPHECDVLYIRTRLLLGERWNNPEILCKLLLLANLYYLYDYADEIIDKFLCIQNSLPFDLNSLLTSQAELRSQQSLYLSHGGLSLWHRDSA